ncbi:MAG: hypothetical protein KGP14_02725 [Betaproteobacteria bacterium]|nr:hypothetical protein [Betaproteobacteria bacterium]
MPEMKFCYCCRVHHPLDQMRLFPTRQGVRWRCVRSIEAAVRSRLERDAFGHQQTLINRDAASRAAEFAQRLRNYATGNA